MGEFSDQQIFTRIKEGDEIAFNKLFNAYYVSLCFFSVKFIADMDLARSIVQQLFVDIWMKRENLKVNHSLKSYLYHAVRNKSIDYLRKEKFKTEITDSIKETYQAPFSDLLEEAELNDRINRSINKLPEKCREIFILCRFDGLKYKQIANKLNISVKTVEMQMGIALKKIRQCLSEKQLAMILFLFV